MPAEPSVILSLWVSAASYPEVPMRNGVRHLLEHLLAKGQTGNIDMRLESNGGFLRAATFRDAMNFEVSVPKDQLALGVSAIQEVMSLRSIQPDEIAQEAVTIGKEGLLKDRAAIASLQAWDRAFQAQAPDPFGNLDVIAATAPVTLAEAHRALFRGPGTALVVAGDVDLDQATALAKSILEPLPKPEGPPVPERQPAKDARSPFVGEGWRGVAVEGFRELSTAASLMAGLAIASELQNAYFVYTPSLQSGVMVVGGDRLDEADLRGTYLTGRELARRWVGSQFADARGVAHLRGLLLCQGAALRPETLLENIDRVTSSDFYQAVAAYGVKL
jgi:predicted Zn-dependent peptidase